MDIWFHPQKIWDVNQLCPNFSGDWVQSSYYSVIMSAMASQVTSLTIVYPNVYSGTDQRKHQSSASLAFVRKKGPHKRPVTRKMSPFDDVIMFGIETSVGKSVPQKALDTDTYPCLDWRRAVLCWVYTELLRDSSFTYEQKWPKWPLLVSWSAR